MRVFVIGGSSLLGFDFLPILESRGHEVIAPAHAEFDITNAEDHARLVSGAFGSIDVCVNCSAYTAVDKAEDEPLEATLLNATGPGYLGATCRALGCRLIHISTDYVFDGELRRPYVETDSVHPLGVYGESKLSGERALGGFHILRTSWLFGAGKDRFVAMVLREWREGKPLKVIVDKVGTPTYTKELALDITAIVENPSVEPGIYHACGPEALTWYEFARLLLETFESRQTNPREVEVEPIKSDDFPMRAKRPFYSAMSREKLEGAIGRKAAPLSESIRDYLDACGL